MQGVYLLSKGVPYDKIFPQIDGPLSPERLFAMWVISGELGNPKVRYDWKSRTWQNR